MEIIRSNLKAFAYTIKPLSKELMNDECDAFFDNLDRLKIKVEYKISERDSKGKLHYHGVILLPNGFYRKRLVVHGYSIKLVEMFDKAGWLKYIHKDVDTEDEKIRESMHNEYMEGLKKPLFKLHKVNAERSELTLG